MSNAATLYKILPEFAEDYPLGDVVLVRTKSKLRPGQGGYTYAYAPVQLDGKPDYTAEFWDAWEEVASLHLG